MTPERVCVAHEVRCRNESVFKRVCKAHQVRCRKGSGMPPASPSQIVPTSFGSDSQIWSFCKSSYSTRAADASPRRSLKPVTLRMRTLLIERDGEDVAQLSRRAPETFPARR